MYKKSLALILSLFICIATTSCGRSTEHELEQNFLTNTIYANNMAKATYQIDALPRERQRFSKLFARTDYGFPDALKIELYDTIKTTTIEERTETLKSMFADIVVKEKPLLETELEVFSACLQEDPIYIPGTESLYLSSPYGENDDSQKYLEGCIEATISTKNTEWFVAFDYVSGNGVQKEQNGLIRIVYMNKETKQQYDKLTFRDYMEATSFGMDIYIIGPTDGLEDIEQRNARNYLMLNFGIPETKLTNLNCAKFLMEQEIDANMRRESVEQILNNCRMNYQKT